MKVSDIVPEKVISNMPDRLFIYLTYYQSKKKLLNLKNPKSFSEKLQWIKIHGNLKQYAKYADKYEVRAYIAKTLGEEYLIPLIGCWDTFDEIPFDTLPKQFVLKATHGSGYNYVCQDKSKIDMAQLKQQAESWLRQNFYIFQRESQYKYLKPRLICEQYIEDETGELRDYKLYCNNGKVKFIEVHSDRLTNHTVSLLDANWSKLPFNTLKGEPDHKVPMPKNTSELSAVAEKLAKDFPFVRVDLYSANNKIYFGELTFTPGDGTFPFIGETDFVVGDMIDLSAFKK